MDKFDNSWICLNRKILSWGWFHKTTVRDVFIYCLLRANWEDAIWQGQEIKRGQFVTSYQHIASALGFTKQEVRTAINKLKSTQEITHKGTAEYSIITVNNYNYYQDFNTVSNTPLTHEQHTSNTQLTTNNNNNNIYTTTIYKEKVKKFLEENKDFSVYGEYQNVFLTEKQKRWLLARITSEKKLNEYIEALSENIACAKDVDFDFLHLEMHKIRINKYYDYERKNRKIPSSQNDGIATEDNYNPFA